jgi:hypothetical protein
VVEPSDLVVSAGGGAVLMKAFDFFVRRYVSKADAREEAAEKEKKDAELADSKKRDEREREMDGKLDQLLKEVAGLTVETRNDRERAAATAAAIQAAVSEVKARIDGVSANHGPRLGAVEQDLAGLRARVDVMAIPRGRK